MVEMGDIVEKLAERTEQDRVPWKPTADEQAFAASLGNLSVLISPDYRGRIKLSVLDEKGMEIDYADRPQSALMDLHSSARRRALGTDRRLAELWDALDANSPIS